MKKKELKQQIVALWAAIELLKAKVAELESRLVNVEARSFVATYYPVDDTVGYLPVWSQWTPTTGDPIPPDHYTTSDDLC